MYPIHLYKPRSFTACNQFELISLFKKLDVFELPNKFISISSHLSFVSV